MISTDIDTADPREVAMHVFDAMPAAADYRREVDYFADTGITAYTVIHDGLEFTVGVDPVGGEDILWTISTVDSDECDAGWPATAATVWLMGGWGMTLTDKITARLELRDIVRAMRGDTATATDLAGLVFDVLPDDDVLIDHVTDPDGVQRVTRGGWSLRIADDNGDIMWWITDTDGAVVYGEQHMDRPFYVAVWAAADGIAGRLTDLAR